MSKTITDQLITEQIKNIIGPVLTQQGYRYKKEGKQWNFYKIFSKHLVIIIFEEIYDHRLSMEFLCPSSSLMRITLLNMKNEMGLELSFDDAFSGIAFNNESELNETITRLLNIIQKFENEVVGKLLSNINPLFKNGFVKEEDGKIVDYWGNII